MTPPLVSVCPALTCSSVPRLFLLLALTLPLLADTVSTSRRWSSRGPAPARS